MKGARYDRERTSMRKIRQVLEYPFDYSRDSRRCRYPKGGDKLPSIGSTGRICPWPFAGTLTDTALEQSLCFRLGTITVEKPHRRCPTQPT